MVVGGFLGSCGWLWVVFWVVVGGCGCLWVVIWVVVDGCGWLWVVAYFSITHKKSMNKSSSENVFLRF